MPSATVCLQATMEPSVFIVPSMVVSRRCSRALTFYVEGPFSHLFCSVRGLVVRRRALILTRGMAGTWSTSYWSRPWAGDAHALGWASCSSQATSMALRLPYVLR